MQALIQGRQGWNVHGGYNSENILHKFGYTLHVDIIRHRTLTYHFGSALPTKFDFYGFYGRIDGCNAWTMAHKAVSYARWKKVKDIKHSALKPFNLRCNQTEGSTKLR